MPLRYGRLKPKEAERVGDMLAKSFGFAPADAGPWLEKAGSPNVRVMRAEGDIVGCLILIPMGQYFGGRSVPCVGVAGVVVPPGARGRGVASDMMKRALRELRKAGTALSTLYPASIPLYRRSGYEIAGGNFSYRVACRDLASAPPELSVRAFEPEDERQVRAVYAAENADRNGWMDRGPYVWERTRRARDGKPTYGHVFHDGKRIEAYVFYRHKSTALGFDLRVSDMAARTPRGARDVMSFLASHKSMADDVAWYGGIDDPWLHLLRDRHYAVRLHHHWMLRVVDIPAALEARGYPEDVSVSLTITVRDDVMSGQSGSYRLRVSNGRSSVGRGGRGGISLDVRTLAALYTSHLDARAAARLGLVEGSPSSIARAATLFSGPPPSMNDLF